MIKSQKWNTETKKIREKALCWIDKNILGDNWPVLKKFLQVPFPGDPKKLLKSHSLFYPWFFNSLLSTKEFMNYQFMSY